MSNNSASNDGGPIIDQYGEQIIEAWNGRQGLKEIASKIPVPIRDINQYIKKIEKTAVKSGGRSHAKKNIS